MSSQCIPPSKKGGQRGFVRRNPPRSPFSKGGSPGAAIAFLALLLAAPAAFACTGDCNGDHTVGVNELVIGVSLSLGAPDTPPCPGLDRNTDGTVSVDELIAAVASALNGCPGQTRAFVLTTNFMAGSFATVDLDEPRTVSRSTPQRHVHRDAVPRVHDGLVYIVNRLFGDNIQVLDPDDDFRTRMECSTGNGTNPHDIAFVDASKAYVTLFERPRVLIVNPAAQPDCHDFVRGSIDLSALADADGIPDLDQMAVVGDRLYVSAQRLDVGSVLRLPALDGALAVIDTATDTLIDVIELTGKNPFGATKGLTVRDGALYVAEAGLFGEMDGGIERVNLDSGRAEGFFITEQDLGGDVTDFVLVSDHLGYAVVSRADFSNSLISFDPTTRAVSAPLLTSEGYTLFDLELNDRGELYLADRNRQHNGVRVFRAADGAALTDGPLDLGLAPFEIVFIR